MSSTDAKPANYGAYWETGEVNENWYSSIFGARQKAHEAFTNWFSDLYKKGEKVSSVIEVGCGRAQYYPKVFEAHHYMGIDISQESIAWCKKNYPEDKARFIAADVIQNTPDVKAEMVFSHAVIDHVYDIDGFIKGLAKLSSKWVYISAYFGWYPELQAHEQTWREADTCFYNKLSVEKVRGCLQSLGAKEIQIYPQIVGNEGNGILVETTIVFRVA